MKKLTYSENKNLTFLLFTLSLVLSVLALLFKKPEAFTKPQFWAEDGVIFFQEYFNNGARSIFTPYAGYIHLVPRIAAMLIFYITSFEYMPLAYNITSLLAFLGIVSFIWCRTAFDPYTKFFMTLALSLAPNGGEVVLNITNVQWYLSLFIPLIFLTGYNKKYVLLDGVVLFLVALTGPFSVIFFPWSAPSFGTGRGWASGKTFDGYFLSICWPPLYSCCLLYFPHQETTGTGV